VVVRSSSIINPATAIAAVAVTVRVDTSGHHLLGTERSVISTRNSSESCSAAVKGVFMVTAELASWGASRATN
jgi:hypothetical protein